MSDLAELRWMLPPLAMCLVLTGIHGYLGIHVLSRKVIFVDLALAQIAALGTAFGYMLGYDPGVPGDGIVMYLFSLGFTFVGAAVFALTRMRHEKVAQEAFIGIVYATASAMAILLLAKLPGESEHIKEMLVGNVLLVTWPAVAKTAAIYSVIGVFHYVFRRPFLEISLDHAAALARGRRVRLWDFAFYASFGFVITSSVAVAGVLLVFSYLIVPAVIAFMFHERVGQRIVAAWAVGTLCSAAGMLVSYYGDLPTAPSVVACFAALLVVASVVYFVRSAERRATAALHTLGGALVLTALLWLTLQARKPPEAHTHESELDTLAAVLATGDETAQIEAIHHIVKFKDPHTTEVLIAALGKASSDRVVEHILEVLPELGDAAASAVPPLVEMGRRPLDPFLRVSVAQALLRLKSASGFAVLRAVLDEELPLLLERKLDELVSATTGRSFGLGRGTPEERAQAAAQLKQWLATEGTRVAWRQDRRRFE